MHLLSIFLTFFVVCIPVFGKHKDGSRGGGGAATSTTISLTNNLPPSTNPSLSHFATGTKFANVTVWAAMIQTDPAVANLMGRDFKQIPQGVNGTQIDNAVLRLENGRKMAAELPFPVEFWWSVFAQSCPFRKTKGNDRGVMLAHHQIWMDFLFQGDHGATKAVATDDDVIVIFEDDAVIAVKDVKLALEKELGHMEKDLVFLGWCYGRRYMPMCTHAYAVTRRGLRKMAIKWDTCSTFSIDGQWRGLAQNNMFTWRKAKDDSYVTQLRPGFEDNPNYFTRGIFTQKNGLVSFNHHGFQNNAG